MIRVSIDYPNGRSEERRFSSKREVEKFVESLDPSGNLEIWVGTGICSVEWCERFHFGW